MDLVRICGVAFAAVLAILSLLAGTISAICLEFPVNAADLPDPGAEEEIRLVFGKVAEIAVERWGNVFADYEVEIVDGLPWYRTKNKKV